MTEKAKAENAKADKLAVIFDMDGVIFDTERLYLEICVPAAEKVGLEGMAEVACKCIGLTEEATERTLREHYGEDAPIEEFNQEMYRIFERRYGAEGLPLKEGAKEILCWLKERGARVAIGSSTRTDLIRMELADAGLIDYFDVIIGGDQAKASKPAPDVFLLAAEALQEDIRDCYIVEDSFNGVRAGKMAGARVLMVPDMLEPTEEIRALADRVFSSLHEVQAFLASIESYIPWETIGAFIKDAFMAYGVPAEDAEICADVLMEADRRGIQSHGCNRFKPIYLDRIKNGTLLPVTELEVLRETPTTLVMDAHDGMGMVASYHMMQQLIAKAKAYGMAGGAIRNSTHYGIAGYWTGMAADAGLVGISGTNARPSIAPTFGIENMLGTNPLTFSLPTDEDFPFCIDCATSIMQRGKVEYYARQGKDTPPGTVITQEGETITESNQILEMLAAGTAAFEPLGGVGEELAGYKGYGYATVVEILSAALSGGQYMKALSGRAPDGSRQMYHLGHFFFVVDPEAFMGLDTFKAIAGDICRQLRASKKMPGAKRIYTAGEKEYEAWLDRRDKGVPVGKSVQQDLIAIRDELNLPYRFSFE